MIISNKAKCLKCGDVIESKYCCDFVTCSCGSLSVDGGRDCLRRLFVNRSKFQELSECTDDDENNTSEESED